MLEDLGVTRDVEKGRYRFLGRRDLSQYFLKDTFFAKLHTRGVHGCQIVEGFPSGVAYLHSGTD